MGEAKALVNPLANALGEVKPQTSLEPLVVLKAEALTVYTACKAMVDTLPVRLAEMEMQTLGETLVKVEAKVLVDTPFETRQQTLTQVNSEAHFNRLARRLSKWRIRKLATHCQR